MLLARAAQMDYQPSTQDTWTKINRRNNKTKRASLNTLASANKYDPWRTAAEQSHHRRSVSVRLHASACTRALPRVRALRLSCDSVRVDDENRSRMVPVMLADDDRSYALELDVSLLRCMHERVMQTHGLATRRNRADRHLIACMWPIEVDSTEPTFGVAVVRA